MWDFQILIPLLQNILIIQSFLEEDALDGSSRSYNQAKRQGHKCNFDECCFRAISHKESHNLQTFPVQSTLHRVDCDLLSRSWVVVTLNPLQQYGVLSDRDDDLCSFAKSNGFHIGKVGIGVQSHV